MEETRRRGRPRKEDNERKRNAKVIRMTDEELSILGGLSTRLGISCSQVMRNALLEYEHQTQR